MHCVWLSGFNFFSLFNFLLSWVTYEPNQINTDCDSALQKAWDEHLHIVCYQCTILTMTAVNMQHQTAVSLRILFPCGNRSRVPARVSCWPGSAPLCAGQWSRWPVGDKPGRHSKDSSSWPAGKDLVAVGCVFRPVCSRLVHIRWVTLTLASVLRKNEK